MAANPTIPQLIADGALFAVNHSGGKDSQAMMLKLAALIPAQQLLIVHATLGAVEWPGIVEHIQATAPALPLIVAAPVTGFFEMVERRGMWPSPKYRQCTSDLKRGPIEREIRRFLAANPQFGGRVVNCMGLRADESADRAKRDTFVRNARNSKAGREWFDWLPIHNMTEAQVFAAIADAGQKPHWAYAAGMTRLSCCFCIMASRQDLTTAATLRPDLYRRYAETERRLDQTFTMPTKTHGRRFLDEVTGIPPIPAAA